MPGGGVGLPPLTVKYCAETKPFCPAQRTGYHPLDTGPWSSTWVLGASEVITEPLIGETRQRRLSPPVLLTVPKPVPGTGVTVGVGVEVAGVDVGVMVGVEVTGVAVGERLTVRYCAETKPF